MDILILAHFCGDFSNSDNGRFAYLAGLLSKRHDVEIVTSDFQHSKKRHRDETGAERAFRVTFLHEPGYGKNVSIKRFQSHFVWGRNVARYLRGRKRPDVIYCAVPSLSGPLAAAEYCKATGVRFLLDVQDLWPEAFRMAFRVPVLSDMAFAPFRLMADRIYRQADGVTAVSRSYAEYVAEINGRIPAPEYVYLGTNLETFDANAARNRPAERGGGLCLGYCGTLGSSYDLTAVLDALALLRGRGVRPPRFLVMGSGPRRAEFERYAAEKGLDVEFTGLLPYDRMCGRLAACDMVVNPIVGTSVASIINKHADYAASGLPVLNTQNSEEYRALVERYRMGFNCENGNTAQLADRLRQLMEDPELRGEMGRNARRCAEECFDRRKTYGGLVEFVEREERQQVMEAVPVFSHTGLG